MSTTDADTKERKQPASNSYSPPPLLPPSHPLFECIHLIENYLPDEQTEQTLIANCLSIKSGWNQVSKRRVVAVGGTVSPKGALIPTPMPSWLHTLTSTIGNKFNLYGSQPANHVLINVYQPGDGIMPHTDGPVYFHQVAILSLGAPAVMRFYWRDNSTVPETACSVFLPPRSLLLFADKAYTECMHGIDFVQVEDMCGVVNNVDGVKQVERASTRVSLTIRRVLKCHKSLAFLMQRT